MDGCDPDRARDRAEPLQRRVRLGVLVAPAPVRNRDRPGNGGPRLHGGLLVHRSAVVDDREHMRGIPITTVPRTLLDIAAHATPRATARAVREAVRLKRITILALGDALGCYRGRRGVARLGATVARYSGLPLERARSGAEVRALELLRIACLPLPRLNIRIASEEADLSWASERLIVEIDGEPFHLDVGEDAASRALGRQRAGAWPASVPTTSMSARTASWTSRRVERPSLPRMGTSAGRSALWVAQRPARGATSAWLACCGCRWR